MKNKDYTLQSGLARIHLDVAKQYLNLNDWKSYGEDYLKQRMEWATSCIEEAVKQIKEIEND